MFYPIAHAFLFKTQYLFKMNRRCWYIRIEHNQSFQIIFFLFEKIKKYDLKITFLGFPIIIHWRLTFTQDDLGITYADLESEYNMALYQL